jgi:hypothetical protein
MGFQFTFRSFVNIEKKIMLLFAAHRAIDVCTNVLVACDRL